MRYVDRAIELMRERGPVGLFQVAIKKAYNRFVWPYLPTGEARQFNGVPVGAERRRLFDGIVPWRTPSSNRPAYEAALVSAIENTVREGDRVSIVGGGYGVSTVRAASAAGKDGAVVVYEPSRSQAAIVERTVTLNDVADWVDVRRKAVAAYSQYAEETFGPDDGEALPPSELPACDVLELDCEGAELEILKGMTIRPRVIIVETHGYLGSPTVAVSEGLNDMGYVVTDRTSVDGEKDVNVLTAFQRGG
jgi:hypothetical protein